MRYVSPSTTKRWGWLDGNPNHGAGAGRLSYIDNGRTFFLGTLVPAFVASGVRLVAGTDAPLPMIVPGYALHDELELLVRAGLSPYAALAAATRSAADMMGASANFGTIAVGRDADLVLLDADPLASIANTRRIAGVLAQGRWYSSDDLHARLEVLARAYSR
jgi:imidazolonepropionase-like amidohydrolase